MYTFMDVFWVALFAYCVGFTMGFSVAAIMAVGSRADDIYTGEQGLPHDYR